MKLLLSNDDGVQAKGIRALALELNKYHDIAIAAPNIERSGASYSMTLTTPLRMNPYHLPELPDVPTYAIDGTPVDCVKLGCNAIDFEADMVVSGMNLGSNLGSDVLYSGTVGAAMEGALQGKPAIAVSINAREPGYLQDAARIAGNVVNYVKEHPLERGMILNVNIPDLPLAQIKGYHLAGLCMQNYDHDHVRGVDPRGKTYFWMPTKKNWTYSPDDQSDERWMYEGYVVLTPIRFDVAAYDYINKMDISELSL